MLEKIKEKIRIKRLVNQKCVTYNYIKHFVGPELLSEMVMVMDLYQMSLFMTMDI